MSMLLGARVLDAHGELGEDMSDSRIKAGVLLATTGKGGADLTPFAGRALLLHEPELRGHEHADPRGRGGSRPVPTVHSWAGLVH